MGRRPVDITGRRFGRLTALSVAAVPHRNNRVIWECICDCGNPAWVSGVLLRRGSTRSCGCLRDELQAQRRQS